MWKILQTLQLPLPGDGETIINSFFVFWSNLVKLSVPYTVQCSKSHFSAKNEWQFFNCSLDYYPALLHQSHCCSPLIPSHAQHCSEAPVWRPGVDKNRREMFWIRVASSNDEGNILCTRFMRPSPLLQNFLKAFLWKNILRADYSRWLMSQFLSLLRGVVRDNGCRLIVLRSCTWSRPLCGTYFHTIVSRTGLGYFNWEMEIHIKTWIKLISFQLILWRLDRTSLPGVLFQLLIPRSVRFRISSPSFKNKIYENDFNALGFDWVISTSLSKCICSRCARSNELYISRGENISIGERKYWKSNGSRNIVSLWSRSGLYSVHWTQDTWHVPQTQQINCTDQTDWIQSGLEWPHQFKTLLINFVII